jgi:FkbM family methyltransferase
MSKQMMSDTSRMQSVKLNVGPGDVVFDIGAQDLAQSAIFASLIGRGDGGVIPFEPNLNYWKNARIAWEKANLPPLLHYGHAYASDFNRFLPLLDIDEWPTLDMPDNVPHVRIDDFLSMCGRFPTVMHIDVNGSELRVLEGAFDTLRDAMPLIYCSIYGDRLAKEGYSAQELYDFLGLLGYRSKLLSADSSINYVFWNPHGRELRL